MGTRKKAAMFTSAKQRANVIRTSEGFVKGTMYNCCFDGSVQSLPSIEALAEGLSTFLGREVKLSGRSEPRFDSSGRIWVDLFPAKVDLFAQRAEVAA